MLSLYLFNLNDPVCATATLQSVQQIPAVIAQTLSFPSSAYYFITLVMQNTVAFVMTEMSSEVVIKTLFQFRTLLMMLQLSDFFTIVQLLQFSLFYVQLMRLEKYQNCGWCWISALKHSDFWRHLSKSIKLLNYCYQLATLSTPCRCIIVILCYGARKVFLIAPLTSISSWEAATTRCITWWKIMLIIWLDLWLHNNTKAFSQCLYSSFLSLVFETAVAVYCYNQIKLNEAPNQL